MSSEPLEDKLRAFNFNVLTIDGHDYDQIEKAIAAFHAESEKPTCILLDTTKGKGVSFMENAVDWHGKGPNDEEYEIAMKELTARADVITPNITEFCLLTDMDYNTLQNSSLSLHQLISCLKDASHTLTAERAKKILITGIRFTTDDGIPKIGNLLLDGSSHFLSAFPCCDGSYSGTGDLFASCIAGGLARGTSLPEMMQTAGSFLEKALADSVKEQVPVNEGVNFEKYLYLLH